MAKFTSTEILSQKKEVESVEVNKSIWSLLDKINQVYDIEKSDVAEQDVINTYLQSQITTNATIVRAEYYGPSQNFTAATYKVVQADTKIEDTHSAVTTGATWKFTCPIAGVYEVTVNPYDTGTMGATASTVGAFIRKNSTTASAYVPGSDKWLDLKIWTASAGNMGFGGSEQIRLAVGDTVTIIGIGFAGGFTGLQSRITIMKVGN